MTRSTQTVLGGVFAILCACNAGSKGAMPSELAGELDASPELAHDAAPLESTEQVIDRYLNDDEYRRGVFVGSLLVADNGYAELRLGRYGLKHEWDALPEAQPRVAPVMVQDVKGEQAAFEPAYNALDGIPSEAQLLTIGRRAFEHWPAQVFASVPLALRSLGAMGTAKAFGFWKNETEQLGGLVWVERSAGTPALAATCSTCHARVLGGEVVHGPPSDITLGASGFDEPGWRAGLVDVTPDGEENPVAIPDLRATRHQRRLHWTGNLKNSLAALAVRIETLLITSAHQATRPPREVALGLALYLHSLGERPSATERKAAATPQDAHGRVQVVQNAETDAGTQVQDADADPGKTIFKAHCFRCHSGPSGVGDWVTAGEVGTDAAVAASNMRGTGGYRVPSLWRVSERILFLHSGYAGTLRQFLDVSSRRDVGHPFGADLDAGERESLALYLETL